MEVISWLLVGEEGDILAHVRGTAEGREGHIGKEALSRH